MKTQLAKMLETLAKMLDRADELSSSDNESTADKYGDVYACLDSAITELTAAVERLDESRV